jgi:hypothetical protein
VSANTQLTEGANVHEKKYRVDKENAFLLKEAQTEGNK